MEGGKEINHPHLEKSVCEAAIIVFSSNIRRLNTSSEITPSLRPGNAFQTHIYDDRRGRVETANYSPEKKVMNGFLSLDTKSK